MKKLLSLMMAVVLVCSAILPFHASATESDLTDYNQHIKLAKEVFPEYAEKLDGNNSTRSSLLQTATSEIYPVVQETRVVDNNTTMTYTEHNNGLITLGTARFKTDPQIIIDDSQSQASFTQYSVTIVASVVEGPTFTATGVRYRIYTWDYDQIMGAGSYSLPGYNNDDFEISMNSVETATQAAYVSYEYPIRVATLWYNGTVTLTVDDNAASVDFTIW